MPLLPGGGVGNNLSEQDRLLETPADVAALRANAGRVFRSFLQGNSRPLRIDIGETAAERVTVHREGSVIQVHVPRVHRGVRVRDSYLIGVINHGNLVLFGANKWGDIDVSANPGVSEAAAAAVVVAHVAPFTIIGAWGGSELVLVPLALGQDPDGIPIGRGYTYRLARILRPSVEGDPGHWEALVDAHSGELISFEDTNQYGSTREVVGGVYPVSNDGTLPDGVEKADWPMPFANIVNAGSTLSTDSGGNLFQCLDGNITSTLSGPFVNINDSCGPISLTSSGDLDFGTSGGTDCTTPGFGGGGNTHASRTGFHELNRIVEMARGQLPNNTWLQQPLTANMNLSLTCNAFWGAGTVNFYRSGGGCANTGEIAGIFDHEWGHGLDDNDPPRLSPALRARALPTSTPPCDSTTLASDATSDPVFSAPASGIPALTARVSATSTSPCGTPVSPTTTAGRTLTVARVCIALGLSTPRRYGISGRAIWRVHPTTWTTIRPSRWSPG